MLEVGALDAAARWSAGKTASSIATGSSSATRSRRTAITSAPGLELEPRRLGGPRLADVAGEHA